MKKTLALLICAMLSASALAGCGGDGGSSSSGTTSGDASTSSSTSSSTEETGVTMSAPGEFPIVEETMEFNITTVQTNYVLDANTNDFTTWYEDLTNIHINYEQIPDSAISEKVSLILASNELPDAFLYCSLTASDIVNYGAQGVFLDLAPMIDEYGYYIPEAFDEEMMASMTAPDGGLYCLANINECYHCMYSGRAWINQTWLDNLGLEYPETTEDLYNVLKAFKEQDANGNGDPNDEIPMIGDDTGWNGKVWDFLMQSFVYNDYGSRIALDENGQINFVANTEAWRDGLRYIRQLIEEGLIDPVSLTQTDAQAQTIAGNPDSIDVGVVTGATWWSELGADLADPLQRSRQYVGLSPLEGPDGVRNVLTSEGGLTTGQFAITNQCENPEVLFRWADGCFSYDATLVSSYGLEGTGWNQPEEGALGINGEPALYDSVTWEDTTTVQNWSMSNIALSNRTNEFRLGDAVDMSDPDVEFTNSELRLYNETSKYFEPYRSDAQVPSLLMTAEESSKRSLIETQIQDYVLEQSVNFLAGNLDLDADWDAYVAEFDNLQLDRYLELMQTAYDRQYGSAN